MNDASSAIAVPREPPVLLVGREALLEELWKLLMSPSPERSVRVAWVCGEPGMGKTALLEEVARRIRLPNPPRSDKPTHLLTLDATGLTTPEALWSALGDGVQRLYGLDPTPASSAQLCRQMLDRPGTHVWMLDQLDDLALAALLDDKADPVATLVRDLEEAARAEALDLCLVVCTRAAPAPQELWRCLHLGALGPWAIRELLTRVLHDAGAPLPSVDDLQSAERIHVMTRGVTTYVLRAFRSALAEGSHLSAWLAALAGSVTANEPAALASVVARRLAAPELAALGRSMPYGFDAEELLAVAAPLLARTARFTPVELCAWFGDRFCRFPTAPPEGVYRDGLAALVRLGFFAAERGAGGFAAGPLSSRRTLLRAMQKDAPLPPAVPLRGVEERRARLEGEAFLGAALASDEALAIEEDYRPHLDDSAAAAAVLRAMLIRSRAEWSMIQQVLLPGVPWTPALGRFLDPTGMLTVLRELVALYDRHRHAYPADSAPHGIVAQALRAQGWWLEKYGRLEEALAAYDEVVARFGTTQEPELLAHVATALSDKHLTLLRLGRTEEVLATLDTIVRLVGDRDELRLRECMAAALFNRGATLDGGTSRNDEAARTAAIASYAELLRRFGDATEWALRARVGKALYNTGCDLRQLRRYEEAYTVFADIVKRFGSVRASEGVAKAFPLPEDPQQRHEGWPDRDVEAHAWMRDCEELAGSAFYNMAAVRIDAGRPTEALPIYEQMIVRYGDEQRVEQLKWTGYALNQKATQLCRLGRVEEELATYDEILARLGSREESVLAEQAVRALHNRAGSLLGIGRYDAALASVDRLITDFGARSPRDTLKFIAHPHLKGFDDVIGARRMPVLPPSLAGLQDGEVIELPFRADPAEHGIARLVLKGFALRGLVLERMGRSGDAARAYEEFLQRASGSRDPEIQHLAAKIRVPPGLSSRALQRVPGPRALWAAGWATGVAALAYLLTGSLVTAGLCGGIAALLAMVMRR